MAPTMLTIRRHNLNVGTLIVFFTFTFNAAALAQATNAHTTPSNDILTYVILSIVSIGVLVGLATVRSSLITSNWSLADALSEEADVSLLDKDGKPIPGPDGKVQAVTELRASSSRLIALIGLIAILMIYLGFGLVILERFSISAKLPEPGDIWEIIQFLIAGMTMFAPYIANKFSSIFDWMTPKKP
jgi:hypothetical protein